ncbi:MAG: hypothetical protein IKT37_04105 [Clostridia bacterium]|nr:hypothetical protein [Clostridia bacterium]
MKKNVMMRVASVLLVAVMLTTCVISGTFAKYVTSGNSFDSARVAKWGVAIEARGTTFATEYDTDDALVSGVISKSVISSDSSNLVAPGTTGTLAESVITGTPEVAVNVKYEATLDISGSWTDGSEEYFPVYFTVGGRTFGTDDSGLGFDVTCANIAELETAVNNAIAAYSANYNPNTNLSTTTPLAVTWNWAFSTSAENDVRDTYLGNLAANDNPGIITLAIITTVTQID